MVYVDPSANCSVGVGGWGIISVVSNSVCWLLWGRSCSLVCWYGSKGFCSASWMWEKWAVYGWGERCPWCFLPSVDDVYNRCLRWRVAEHQWCIGWFSTPAWGPSGSRLSSYLTTLRCSLSVCSLWYSSRSSLVSEMIGELSSVSSGSKDSDTASESGLRC